MLFEKYRGLLMQAIINCNQAFNDGDVPRNAEEYGQIDAYARICEDLGHDVIGQVRKQDGVVTEKTSGLRWVEFMTVDGKRLFENEILPQNVSMFSTKKIERKEGNDGQHKDV